MNLKARLKKLEAQMGRRSRPCPDDDEEMLDFDEYADVITNGRLNAQDLASVVANNQVMTAQEVLDEFADVITEGRIKAQDHQVLKEAAIERREYER